MRIHVIDESFAVCKVTDYSLTKTDSMFCFIGKTDEENSLVCLERDIPANAQIVDRGWYAFRVEGILDFSLIGILAGIADILAKAKISIFAVSTYNTDYILVKNRGAAIGALKQAGYELTE